MAVLMISTMFPAVAFAGDIVEEEDNIPAALPKTVTLGTYELDGNTQNGKEPIVWKILKTNEDGSMLLISENVLFTDLMHTSRIEIPQFVDTSLFASLNSTFFNTAFSAEDKLLLNSVGTNNSTDYYVRLLTKDEATIGNAACVFADGNDRIAQNYAGNVAAWWLSTAAAASGAGAKRYFTAPTTNANTFTTSSFVDVASGVRPVIFVKKLPVVTFTKTAGITYKDLRNVAFESAYVAGSFKFTVKLAEVYDESVVAVKLNGTPITADEKGIYTVTCTNDAAVAVEGLTLNPQDILNYTNAVARFNTEKALNDLTVMNALVETDTSDFLTVAEFDGLAASVNGGIDKMLVYYNAVAKYNGIPDKTRYNLTAVEALVNTSVAGYTQPSEFEALGNQINAALAATPADYTAYDLAKAAGMAKYTDSTTYNVSVSGDSPEATAAKALRDALYANVAGKNVLQQKVVDDQTAAINTAADGLYRKASKYLAEWQEAKRAALTLVPENYVDFSAVTAAIDVADYDNFTGETDTPPNPDNRYDNEVHQAALNINAAVAALVLRPADFTEFDKAVALAKSMTLEDYYEDEAWAILQEKIADCEKYDKTGKTFKDNQEEIDKLTEALTLAIADATPIPSFWDKVKTWFDENFGEAFRWLKTIFLLIGMLIRGEIDIKEIIDML